MLKAKPRLDPDARREAILDVAQEVFLEEGFAAASMSTIAARLGGSKGTLYNYFRSKDELFKAYVERRCLWQQDEIFDLTSGETPEAALLRMAAGWLERGRRVTLVLGSREGPLAAELPEGIDLIELNDPRYSALFGLAEHVRARQPDLIFCPGNHYSAVAAMARLKLGRTSPPIVAKVSNALVRAELRGVEAWGYRRWLRLHPRFIDHLVAMSPAMRDEAIAQMRFAPDRVSVVANPPALPRPDAAPIALPTAAISSGSVGWSRRSAGIGCSMRCRAWRTVRCAC